MNTEIELKFNVSNLSELESKIKDIGAEFKGEKSCKDTYFIVPNNPEGRKYLRIRETNNKSELAYHYFESQSHTKEWETGITDPKTTLEILKQLEYKIDVIVNKNRKTYKYNYSEIVLDQVENLGEFIEIESSTLEEINKIATKIGLNADKAINDSGYPDLIRSKCKPSSNPTS